MATKEKIGGVVLRGGSEKGKGKERRGEEKPGGEKTHTRRRGGG